MNKLLKSFLSPAKRLFEPADDPQQLFMPSIDGLDSSAADHRVKKCFFGGPARRRLLSPNTSFFIVALYVFGGLLSL